METAARRAPSALASLDLTVPRPLWATYVPPGTLRRWLPVTEAAVRDDSEAADTARLVRDLVGRLRARWVPAAELPMHLVHGDVRLGNVSRSPSGETVYLDFGFLAHRPRIHELGYSLAWMVLALDGHQALERFPWDRIPGLVAAYEATAGVRLTPTEWQALAPYAAVPLYQATIAGFVGDPAGALNRGFRRPFLRLSEWLLAHPEAVRG